MSPPFRAVLPPPSACSRNLWVGCVLCCQSRFAHASLQCAYFSSMLASGLSNITTRRFSQPNFVPMMSFTIYSIPSATSKLSYATWLIFLMVSFSVIFLPFLRFRSLTLFLCMYYNIPQGVFQGVFPSVWKYIFVIITVIAHDRY